MIEATVAYRPMFPSMHASDCACPRCGYDLRGRPPRPIPLCPECGILVTAFERRRRARRQRSRREWLLMLVLLAVMFGLLLIVPDFFGVNTAH